jgi:hypothetical protein
MLRGYGGRVPAISAEEEILMHFPALTIARRTAHHGPDIVEMALQVV